jgi:hypothetical protein
MFAVWTYVLLFALISLLLLYPEGLDKFVSTGLQPEYLFLIGSPAAAAVLAKQATSAAVNDGGLTKTTNFMSPQIVSQSGGGTLQPQPGAAQPGDEELQPPQAQILAQGVALQNAAGGPQQQALGPGPSGSPGGYQGSGYSGLQSGSLAGATTPPGPIVGGAQLISDDDGKTDLIDFQYLCFNLVALAYFLLKFVPNPGLGLPALPPTLLVLTSTAAAGYVATKYFAGTSDPKPTINSANPNRIILGRDRALDIAGVNFGEEDPASMPPLCQVTLNRRPLTLDRRRILAWHPEWIRVGLPADQATAETEGLIPAGTTTDMTVDLMVYDRYGRASPTGSNVVIGRPAAQPEPPG